MAGLGQEKGLFKEGGNNQIMLDVVEMSVTVRTEIVLYAWQ